MKKETLPSAVSVSVYTDTAGRRVILETLIKCYDIRTAQMRAFTLRLIRNNVALGN